MYTPPTLQFHIPMTYQKNTKSTDISFIHRHINAHNYTLDTLYLTHDIQLRNYRRKILFKKSSTTVNHDHLLLYMVNFNPID